MVWTVASIMESDYGCEERMPGEPLTVMVTLTCEDGRMSQFEIADDWLRMQEIEEGDEWPEDLDAIDEAEEKGEKMSEFMQNFLEALSEL